MTPGFYLDDDTGVPDAVKEISRHGVEIERSDDVGMRGKSDAEHLEYAASRGLVMVTCNRRDFQKLHWERLEAGREHAGIFIVKQAIPVGERIRRLLFVSQVAEAEDLRGTCEFLEDWQ